jgi:hypothetical protein
MSWDVLLINSKTPVNIDSEDIPEFLSRTDFINKVKQVLPVIDWPDPSIGILDSVPAVIEFNTGDEEAIGSEVLLHVYGGEDPVEVIVDLCKQNNWQAYDLSTESYIDLDNPSRESWNKFDQSRGLMEE